MTMQSLEKQIKNRLANREIEPSVSAFDRLNFELSQNKTHSKSRLWWIGVAASLLLFFSTSLLFWKDQFVSATSNQLVQKTKKVQTVFSESNKKVVVENKKLNTNPKTIVTHSEPKSKSKTAETQVPITTIEEVVVAIQSNPEIVEKDSITPKTILANTIKTSSKISVDPKRLLSGVEQELDASFREKIISKINKNYQEIKVVVSSRNQE